MASPALHLIILLLCFILVRCGWWPSLHHRRIDSLSLRARTKINQVVEESWEELLLCAKDLMDTRLEDGKEFVQTFCDRDLLYFSCQTRRYIFYSKMPQVGLTSLTELKTVRKTPLMLSRPWCQSCHLLTVMKSFEAIVIWNHVLTWSSRGAGDLPATGVEEEIIGE